MEGEKNRHTMPDNGRCLMEAGYGVRASMREKCTMKENENRA